MRRLPSTPRPDWRDRVESQGLVYPTTVLEDGTERPYWFESAYYELDSAEVDQLESTTEVLHRMCVEAAHALASGEYGDLGLPPGALEVARANLATDPPSLLGRFDLHWDGEGPAKLLEYNADTPTGLVESSIAQWYWLQDVHPELDQWNSLHERLVLGWEGLRRRLPDATVWFAHHEDEPTGEELMTVTYLRDTADQAGLRTASITVGDIGYDPARRCFVGLGEEPLRSCFTLYPWEQMLGEEFGAYVDPDPRGVFSTWWLEPPWKVLLSNKALLAALWDAYPGHPNLLPAYLHSPRDLEAWVAKPLHGREGEGIRIHAPGVEITQPGDYGAEGWCYQQWCPLPEFDGNKAVLGSWVVDGIAAGVGIRESDGWVTDYDARFVPHVIAAPAPDAAQREEWLEDARDLHRQPVQEGLTGLLGGTRPEELPVITPLGEPRVSPIPVFGDAQDTRRGDAPGTPQDTPRRERRDDGRGGPSPARRV